MRIEDAKVGTKVFWPGTESVPADHGVIVERHGRSFGPDTVWVEWSNGEILWMDVGKLVMIEDAPTKTEVLTEEAAVMLLLRLGYTVTKGKV